MSAKKIWLIGCGRMEEAVAASAVSPGHLIELDSNGKVQPHSTADGFAERAFATEDSLQGNTTGDDYAADDQVSYVICAPGDVVQAMLAAGENASIGSKLCSNGDGTLKVVTGTEQVIAVALEAQDLSDTGDVDTLTRVRVL